MTNMKEKINIMQKKTNENYLRQTEIATSSNSNSFQEDNEGQGKKEKPSPRKMILTNRGTASLFFTIAQEDIEEEKKLGSKRKQQEDMLALFPEIASTWREIASTLLKAKANKKSFMKEANFQNVIPCYSKFCGMFTKLISKIAIDLENEAYYQRAFSQELIYSAILGIEYTHSLLFSEIFERKTEPGSSVINIKLVEEYFTCLRTFNEFFFVLTRIKCNTILPERHLFALQNCLSKFFDTLQKFVEKNAKIIKETLQEEKCIATFIYYVLQTIAALAIFGETAKLSQKKYTFILDRFKTIFALISKSPIFEKLYGDIFDFESEWQDLDLTKCILSSFNQKRLSLYVLKSKLQDKENIRINLRYVVISYNYKILKIVSQRLKLNYDEHLISMLSDLHHKNIFTLENMPLSKQKLESMNIILLINESSIIIKTYILTLAFFSEKLDMIQRQSNYEVIKKTAVDCFLLIMKTGMYDRFRNKDEINSVTIGFPRDLLAVIFKSLLHFIKIKGKIPLIKHGKDLVTHANLLIVDLISRLFPTDDTICLYLYKLYLFQYITKWDAEDLKGKLKKYSEEISRVFNDSDDSQEITQYLKDRIKEYSIEIYVKLSAVDCLPGIEATLSSIKENCSIESKLYMYFFILSCLLLKRKIEKDLFEQILKGNKGALKETFGKIQPSKETEAFSQQNGMGLIMEIYRNSISSYAQYQISRKDSGEDSRKGNEVNNYIEQSYYKKLNETLDAYTKIMQITGSFLYALQYINVLSEASIKESIINSSLCEKLIVLQEGREFLLKILEIYGEQIIKNIKKEDVVDIFIGLLLEVYMISTNSALGRDEEKEFIILLNAQVERLTSNSVVKYIIF